MNRLQDFALFLASLLFAGCGEMNNDGFATTEDLKEAFRTAFEGGDIDALMGLVYWDDTPEEVRETYEMFFSLGAGRSSINRLEVVTFETLAPAANSSGREIELVIEPTHWLAVAFSGNTGYKESIATGTLQFAVGIVEGRYYIAGARFTEGSNEGGEADPSPAVGKLTVEEYFDDGNWTPPLHEGQQLLRIVSLAPGEVLPIEGVIETPGTYGIRVKESWDLKDREEADGKDYWVYLRSPSSTPERPNSVGTTYGASNRFTPGEGIKFEVANETPLPVTVAIYTEDPDGDSE